MPESSLSQREKRRYSKQILIPEIGAEGQEKFKRSSVIVVGAGGLGCPVLQYLVAGGVGRVALVDFDMVDETNLQRQLLYGSKDLGKLKSVIARTRLEELNPMVKIEVLNLTINASNSLNIFKDFDIVVDATDNFESRFIINDSCVILNKPMVHGAIHKFEGEVSVFNYKNGPTYRCYNPFNTNGNYEDQNLSDPGVLGVLAGITGSVMANEVFKIIAGIGDILAGKILIINILNNTFHTMKITGIPENHNIKEVGIIAKKS